MIKTVNLNGTEMCVNGLGGTNTAIVNRGTETVYASAHAGIAPGADGVIAIGGGTRDGLTDTNGTVYLLGSGEVNLRGTDESVNFRSPSLSAGGASSAGNGGSSKLMPVMSGITGYFVPETINIDEGVWSNGIANAFNNVSLHNCVLEGSSVHFSESSNGTFSSAAEPNVMYAVIKMNGGGSNGNILTKGITSVYSSYSFNFMAENGNHVYFSSRGYNIASGIKGGEYNVYCASRDGSTVHFYANGEEMSSTATAARGYYNNAIHFNFGLEPSCDFNLMMCAFGTDYHTPEEAEQNCLWLMGKMNDEWGAI